MKEVDQLTEFLLACIHPELGLNAKDSDLAPTMTPVSRLVHLDVLLLHHLPTSHLDQLRQPPQLTPTPRIQRHQH